MNQPELVMAIYRPNPGKLPELENLVRKHFQTLKEAGLTTNRDPFVGRSTDGSIIEVFEWASRESAEKAHSHPAVAKIWEAMAEKCSFGKLEQLPEATKPFPHFAKF